MIKKPRKIYQVVDLNGNVLFEGIAERCRKFIFNYPLKYGAYHIHLVEFVDNPISHTFLFDSYN